VTSPAGSALRAHDLRVRRGRREVVRGIDLDVAAGEVVAILGPNGAGKSTLLEALGGVLPSTGQLVVPGRVATVMQTPGLARRTVRANVLLALAWWRVPRAERATRADDALRSMRADHLARRQAWTLSGGERRRVHLARGVALQADVLLLDEPFAGLDPEAHGALVDDAAAALRAAAGSVVIVLHERADAWALADRVVVVTDGRVAAVGPPAELMAAPPTVEVARFLGYDGSIATGDVQTLTRPAHVGVFPDPHAGELAATVTRTVRVLDGNRVDLEADGGRLVAHYGGDDIRVGQRVGVQIRGGVTFPRDGG
jgi:ABC-type sugar transport system ATPase subunit